MVSLYHIMLMLRPSFSHTKIIGAGFEIKIVPSQNVGDNRFTDNQHHYIQPYNSVYDCRIVYMLYTIQYVELLACNYVENCFLTVNFQFEFSGKLKIALLR